MDIRKKAEQLEPFIIERRRFYHRIPELAGKETETTRAIADDLAAMGIEPKPFKKYTGLTAIGSHAFENCHWLSAAFLPDGLQVIGDSAFRNCSALVSVSFPASSGIRW